MHPTVSCELSCVVFLKQVSWATSAGLTEGTRSPISPLSLQVKVSSAVLKAAAHHYGAQCDKPNKEFMLCRWEEKDPRRCLEEGKLVNKCALDFFRYIQALRDGFQGRAWRGGLRSRLTHVIAGSAVMVLVLLLSALLSSQALLLLRASASLLGAQDLSARA